ncbi:TPA: hypothetical protein ACH3X1_002961 [Trebouxia sp. C0004]
MDDRRGQAAETYMQPDRLYATVEVLQWMSSLSLKETVNIASEVLQEGARRDQIDPIVGCPVFQEGFKDDPNGNMCPMEKLAPVTLTVARHRKSGWVCLQ